MTPDLLFDIETNGLLDELDRVHCISIVDVRTGKVEGYADQPGYAPISEALARLSAATCIGGHNILGFDIPALQKVYPEWTPPAKLFDTLVAVRTIWPEERSHSLMQWGLRLKVAKGDYKGGWEAWSEDMHSYCLQDAEVTLALYEHIAAQQWSERSFDLEHAFAQAIILQERRGFAFDTTAAHQLYAILVGEKAKLEAQLQDAFPPWIERVWTKTAKRNMTLNLMDEHGVAAKRKIVPGEIYSQHVRVVFNPGSRHHIANRLKAKYQWEPAAFTDGGQPQVDEAILGALPWDEAKLLTQYLKLGKNLGQLAEGEQAWLKLERAGVIYGRVNTNGAITGRCTHSKPNVAQVDSDPKFRRLFIARPGFLLVGVDAKGLELRCLAHFLAMWDNGAYAELVTSGDPHSFMAEVTGLTRSDAKVFTYAFLYGAGDRKLGSILKPHASEAAQRRIGKALRARVQARFGALAKLQQKVHERYVKPGFLVGLDGRRMKPRTKNSALNTLLQSAGAIVMKQALVLLHERLTAAGWVFGEDYAFVANIHDEIQAEVRPDRVEEYKVMAVQAIRDAGPALGFRCPLDGDAKHGPDWSQTH